MQRLSILLFLLFLAVSLTANNVRVSDIQVPDELVPNPSNPNQLFLDISFDLAWDNSWRTQDPQVGAQYDGVYFFTYYRIDSSEWRILGNNISASNPSPPDFIQRNIAAGGNFIYRSTDGTGDVSIDDIQIKGIVDGRFVNSADEIEVRVFTIEMVWIPASTWYLGSPSGDEPGSFHVEMGNDPNYGAAYLINSSSGVSFGTASTNQVTFDTGPTTGSPSGSVSRFTYPMAYNTYWMMKYEVTEGQYVDFFNSLTDTQQPLLDITGPKGKDSDAVVDGNTISWASPGQEMTTAAPDRAIGYVSQDMILSYLNWAGLRAPSELEYEKAARSYRFPVENEYAWGSDQVAANEYIINGAGTDNELVSNPSGTEGNGNYSATAGVANSRPYRTGIFAASASVPNRELTGGSAYGIMELSGNLTEATISLTAVANTANSYSYPSTSHGTFQLDADGYPVGSSFNTRDNPDIAYWSLRGGSYADPAQRLRITDRTEGEVALTARATVGFRGVTSRQ